MSEQFTPGPWEVQTTPRLMVPGHSHREILGGGDREGRPIVLGEVYSGDDHDEPEDCVAEANANLIASAPKLYAALIDAVELLEQSGFSTVEHRAALALARGEQSVLGRAG